MANINYDSVLNPTIAKPEETNSDFYRASAKNAPNGVYLATIKFITYVKNPDQSIMSKRVSWVVNPYTKKGVYVDDPRSIGEDSPVGNMFSQLWSTENKNIREFAKKHLSSKTQYASIIQIIDDKQNPQYNGQFKIFLYGNKIKGMIDEELNPQMGGPVIHPFNPYIGRRFFLKCKLNDAGFNDVDNSTFFDYKDSNGELLPCGMLMPNASGVLEPITSATPQEEVINYILSKAPDISKCGYHPWTEYETKHVMDTLKVIADSYKNGTLGMNPMSVLSTGNQAVAGVSANNMQSMFPGANVGVLNQQQAPQTGFQPQGMGATQQPQPQMNFQPHGMPQTAPQQAPQTGFQPQVMPNPQPAQQTNFQPQDMGAAQQQQATVTGVELPNVKPQASPSFGSQQTMGVAGGDIDDILGSL